MSSEENQNANSTDESESRNKINELIEALNPLCQEISWLRGSIEKLKASDFPNTEFEVSGLARLIAYEMINQRPDLFTENNIKTLPLKELIIQYINNINVTKKRNEDIAKIAEEVFNNLTKEHISMINKRFNSR